MKTGKRFIAMLFFFALTVSIMLPATAFAQGVNQVALKWETRGDKADYNLQDKGKDVQLVLLVNYWRANNANNKMYYGHYMTVDVQIGVDTVIPIPESGPFKGEDGVKYNDWVADSAETMPSDLIPSYTVAVNTTGNTINAYAYQQMNFATKGVVENDAIVLENDWKDMTVHFTMIRRKMQNGQVVSTDDPYINDKTKAIVEEKVLFPQNGGQFRFLTRESASGSRLGSFYWACVGERLSLYNSYTGKYREYSLVANWADGARKADIEERYSLAITGNDLDGWQLTLHSNIKKDETSTTQNVAYKTIYEDDNTMYKGQTKVKTPGVNGTEKVTTTTYYLEKADGRKTLDTKVDRTTITPPTDEVVLRGTKTRPSSGGSDITIDTTIYVDPNGGTFSDGTTAVKTYTVTVGERFTLPEAPIREGYKFLYWKGSKYQPGDQYTVEAGGHTFIAEWEKDEKKPEDKPSAPSVDPNIKTPRGSALTHEEIAKILRGMKANVPAIPKAGVGR